MSQSNRSNHDPIPEEIAPIPENLTGESVDPQSQDANTLDNSTDRFQQSDSSDVSAPNEEWETVNLPNSINVDELEIAEDVDPETAIAADSAKSDETYPLPLDYAMETIASRIAAQKSEEGGMDESADAELYQRIEHLETILTRYQRSLDEQQLSARTQQAEIEAKMTQLQGAQKQINQLSQELELCQTEMKSSQMAIAALSENWKQSQQRLAQLERECATTQQRYNQQVQLNLQAANTCRELRARLHRQQRQALQFKAALEKSLTQKESSLDLKLEGLGTTKYSTQVDSSANDFSSSLSVDSTVDPVEIYSGGVGPKSVPIEPWSKSEPSLSDVRESSEAIAKDPNKTMASTTFNPETLSTESTESSNDSRQLAGSETGLMSHPMSETFWPEEDNLIETIRNLVSTDSANSGANIASPSMSEPNPPNDQPLHNPDVNLTQLTDRVNDPMSQDEVKSSLNEDSTGLPEKDPDALDANSPIDSTSDSPVNFDSLDTDIWEIPEVPDPIPDDSNIDDRPNWPAPVVYPEHSSKKRRSLAAVELPSFPSKK